MVIMLIDITAEELIMPCTGDASKVDIRDGCLVRVGHKQQIHSFVTVEET